VQRGVPPVGPALAWPIALEELRISERRCAFSVLRLWRPPAALYGALGREFDLSWPEQPNRCSAAGAAAVLWLTPVEWAIVGLAPAEVAARAARACGTALHDVADLSDGRVEFALHGARARALLAKGCSLDLHPRALAPEACAQTLLAQVPVLIAAGAGAGAAAAAPLLRLWVDASLAQHLRAWFCDAALEYA
jgi:sarcosine oxidase subunit gamma